MAPWDLTDQEWEQLRPLLGRSGPARRGRGRPRCEDRAAAAAILYHHHHSHAQVYSSFGWNDLPRGFGISPATANRRYREWSADGRWVEFYRALLALRREQGQPAGPGRRPRPRPSAPPSLDHPVSDMLQEIGRAYRFFNDLLFGAMLPAQVAITIREPRRADTRLGSFCGQSWRHRDRVLDHICLFSSVLVRGVDQVLETLIHEMVHLRNFVVHLEDCTAGGRYHNQHFRDSALLYGLEVVGGCDQHRGYGHTRLGRRGREAVARLRPRRELFAPGCESAEP